MVIDMASSRGLADKPVQRIEPALTPISALKKFSVWISQLPMTSTFQGRVQAKPTVR
jgi:hypothetical protein